MTKIPNTTQRGKWLRHADVCELLDISIHAVKRARLRDVDPMPCHRIGARQVRYSAAEVRAWAKRQKN